MCTSLCGTALTVQGSDDPVKNSTTLRVRSPGSTCSAHGADSKRQLARATLAFELSYVENVSRFKRSVSICLNNTGLDAVHDPKTYEFNRCRDTLRLMRCLTVHGIIGRWRPLRKSAFQNRVILRETLAMRTPRLPDDV
jgi:hypothetical protein